MLPLFLIPAAILQVPAGAAFDVTEVSPGILVLRGAPNAATYAAMKEAHITHVVNLRQDGEPGFDFAAESNAINALGISYIRLAMGRTPSKDDLDLFRMIIGDLPASAKVLVHCGTGNRAAGALCAWLVLDKGRKLEEAVAIAKQAGLSNPETEGAVRKYLGLKMKS